AVEGSLWTLAAGELDMIVNRAVLRVETRNPAKGGGDTIIAGDGANIVFGGTGSDRIFALGGGDVVMGDNGYVTFRADAGGNYLPQVVATAAPEYGDADTITSLVGRNIVAGGSGSDGINVVSQIEIDLEDYLDAGVIAALGLAQAGFA